jgi:hypothetical protein
MSLDKVLVDVFATSRSVYGVLGDGVFP